MAPASPVADREGASGLARLLELFWHPVATLDELEAAAPHPLAVHLLGRRLAVADLGAAGLGVVQDRCLHRSSRLSVGWVDDGAFRCGYHGWRWDAAGRCVEIPSMPEGPIPPGACIPAFEAQLAYGLVWVRLDGSGDTLPACPAWDEASMKVVAGEPYTWPVGAPCRVENFVDLAHFAWVHDGSLGRRDQPVPPLPRMRREGGELRFDYDPPEMDAAATALLGYSRYRMPIPLTVSIDFGRRRAVGSYGPGLHRVPPLAQGPGGGEHRRRRRRGRHGADRGPDARRADGRSPSRRVTRSTGVAEVRSERDRTTAGHRRILGVFVAEATLTAPPVAEPATSVAHPGTVPAESSSDGSPPPFERRGEARTP